MITHYFLTIDQYHRCRQFKKYLKKLYWNKLHVQHNSNDLIRKQYTDLEKRSLN